jgi:hypothetical protein
MAFVLLSLVSKLEIRESQIGISTLEVPDYVLQGIVELLTLQVFVF